MQESTNCDSQNQLNQDPPIVVYDLSADQDGAATNREDENKDSISLKKEQIKEEGDKSQEFDDDLIQPEDTKLRDDTLKTNLFNRIGVVVNLILAIVTVVAVVVSVQGVKIANDTLKYAIQKDSVSAIREKMLDSITIMQRKVDSNFSALANKRGEDALSAQINAASNNREDFRKVNRAFLQIDSVKIIQFSPNKPIRIDMKVDNLGSYPAKVIGFNFVIGTKVTAPTLEDASQMIRDSTRFLNRYIIKGSPIVYPIDASAITQSRYDAIMTIENIMIHLAGYITYINLITNEIYKYEFQLKLKPGGDATVFTINENRKIP